MGGDQRAGAGRKGPEEAESLLDGVPRFPALILATELQKRAAKVGFDWARKEDVRVKLLEELEELFQADSSEKREEELGICCLSPSPWPAFSGRMRSRRSLGPAANLSAASALWSGGRRRRARDWRSFPWRSWTSGGTRPKSGDFEKTFRGHKTIFSTESRIFSLSPNNIPRSPIKEVKGPLKKPAFSGGGPLG